MPPNPNAFLFLNSLAINHQLGKLQERDTGPDGVKHLLQNPLPTGADA